MASFNNFQSDNQKYSKDRYDIYNPNFDNPIQKVQDDFISKNIHKWLELISFLKFYPDIAYDLIKPPEGKQLNFDLDQRVVLRCLVRFFNNYNCIPRGAGKCVTGDTIIFTDEGLREIGEIFNYSKLDDEFETRHSYFIANRFGKLELSSAGIINGKKSIKHIITNEGYELKCTLNHPVLIMNKNGELQWKNTEEIKIGDYLPIARNIDLWGNNLNLNIDMDKFINSQSKQAKHQILRNCKIPTILTEKLAIIIGYLLGDGCLTRKHYILFTNKDKDIIDNFINYFENELLIKVKQKDEINYIVNGTYIREIFNQIGLKQTNAFDKEIPSIIMKSPKNIVVNVLRGLFDTDGTVSNKSVDICTASKKMAKQIHLLLLNFGIISSRKKRFNKKFKTYHYRIGITGFNIDLFNKYIGFSCERKQEKLNNICNIKRNTNNDIIPYQNENIRIIHPKGFTRDLFYHVLKNNNNLTYNKSHILLDKNERFENKGKEYENILLLNELNYFYSPITEINDGEDYVYDVHMPKTHSFISNGIISHNTLNHILADYHIARFFPGISLSVMASTKQSAVDIWEDKHNEIMEFYPSLQDEIRSANFSKDSGKVIWVNGSKIDALAMAQTSKGKRRRRGGLEESNLIDKDVFEDAVAPIFNVPRKTLGNIEDPTELNGQMNRFTTSGYKNSDEYEVILNIFKDMINLKGAYVFGADWRLPVHFGRQKMSVVNNARKASLTRFKTNYLCEWIGSSDGALINVSKLLKCRTLGLSDIEIIKDLRTKSELPEFIIGVDVARKINNRTSITVGKLIKSQSGKLRQIHIVEINTPPQNLNYEEQAIIVKKIFYKYGGDVDLVKSRVKAIVVDANSWGQGLVEKLLEEQTDFETNKELCCFDTMNTDDKPKVQNAPKLVYALTSQGINSDIIRCFVDYFESGRVKLIRNFEDIKAEFSKNYNDTEIRIQCEQITRFIDEVANLKQITNDKTKSLNIEQNVKSIDKDRYSSTAYMLYYIKMFIDVEENKQDDLSSFFIAPTNLPWNKPLF